MKRIAFVLAALIVITLAALGISAPAQAAPSNQTVPATATPVVTATPIPGSTPTSPWCRILTRIPNQIRLEGIQVFIRAEGAPGPGWRIMRSLPTEIIAEGQLEPGYGMDTMLDLEWDVNYTLQIQSGSNTWHSSPGCQFRYQRIDVPTGTPTPSPTVTPVPTQTPTPTATPVPVCPYLGGGIPQLWVYGYVYSTGDSLIEAGAVVRAYDDDGTIVGCQETVEGGILQFMPLYPSPYSNSAIHFTVNDKEYVSTPDIDGWWDVQMLEIELREKQVQPAILLYLPAIER